MIAPRSRSVLRSSTTSQSRIALPDRAAMAAATPAASPKSNAAGMIGPCASHMDVQY